MNFYDNYAQLISNAINLVETSAIETDTEKYLQTIGIVPYLAEFKTVGLVLPRRVGKTTFIVEHAQPWDLIITRNQEMANRMVREVGVNGPTVKSFGGFSLGTPRGYSSWDRPKYRRIWFDEVNPKCDSGTKIEQIYLNYGFHPRQTFVFLST